MTMGHELLLYGLDPMVQRDHVRMVIMAGHIKLLEVWATWS
jgi:hypothetical protein